MNLNISYCNNYVNGNILIIHSCGKMFEIYLSQPGHTGYNFVLIQPLHSFDTPTTHLFDFLF